MKKKSYLFLTIFLLILIIPWFITLIFKNLSFDFILNFTLIFVFLILGIPILLIVLIIMLSIFSPNIYKKYEYNFEGGKELTKDIKYLRKIPSDNNLFKAYFVAKLFNLIKNDTDVLGAFILKWVKDNIITMEIIDNKRIFNFKITDDKKFENDIERKLHEIFLNAGHNGKLEENEFEKWCFNNHRDATAWINSIEGYGRDFFINEGLLKTIDKKVFISQFKPLNVDIKIRNYAIELAGLKKFLEDFSRIKEKKVLEVKLFDDYLIYAKLFGISDNVTKELEYIYPKIIKRNSQDTYYEL